MKEGDLITGKTYNVSISDGTADGCFCLSIAEFVTTEIRTVEIAGKPTILGTGRIQVQEYYHSFDLPSGERLTVRAKDIMGWHLLN